MREYPWHARPVLAVHLRLFDAVLVKNRLIQSWLAETSMAPAVVGDSWKVLDQIPESAAECEATLLPWLENWAEVSIGSRTPEEALEELFRAVRVREAQVVDLVHRRHPDRLARLRELARTAGAAYASRAPLYDEPTDLRGAFPRLLQLPFQWLNQPSRTCCVSERSSRDRLDWIHVECPHQDPLLEPGPVVDLLCSLHECWLAGYFSTLYQTARLDRLEPDSLRKFCRFRLELT